MHRAVLSLLCITACLVPAACYRPQLRSRIEPIEQEENIYSVRASSHPANKNRQNDEPQEPGIQLVARQAMFNYATQEGLGILKSNVQNLVIPDVEKVFNLPIVGEFKLHLSNLHITQFNALSEEARLAIMDGHFDLWVTQVEAQLTFNWHWEKLGMTGTGSGELDLSGGNIDYRFRVLTSGSGKPAIAVDDANTHFQTVNLQIKSFSADWLYQAVMSLFNDQIQKAVQNGIAYALLNDVPTKLNAVLDTLPTKVDITGLPFSTSFEYSIFTLKYVMVQGYGMVESDVPSPSVMELDAYYDDVYDDEPVPQHTNPKHANELQQQLLAARQQQLKDQQAGDYVQRLQLGRRKPSPVTVKKQSQRAIDNAKALMRCPFTATPLPVTPQSISDDGHMISIFLHESMANCMLWGLFRSNALQYDLRDGTIPKLHLTTDLLAMLIPQLPKKYPHQYLRIFVAATALPHVSFSADEGTTIQASYRTTIWVANETAGNPKVATLAANLTIKGQINYDSTIIKSVVAKHTVEEASMPVSPIQWDNTVAWFVQNYAGLFPVSSLINKVVHTPVTSLVSLVNPMSKSYDGWYMLSGDVQMHPQHQVHEFASL